MRQMLILATGLATVCGGLSACATPAYPISMPEPARPAETRTAQLAPPAVAGPVSSAPAAVTEQSLPAASTPLVDSRPLPPADIKPSTIAEPSPPPPVVTRSVVTPPPRPQTEGRMIATGKVVAATRMFRDYQVQKGDHLFAIARDFQTTAGQLTDANNLKSPNQIRPGQHLKIPIDKAYVAETGDTLSSVAKRFGVGVADLSELNNLAERSRLRAGDKIALPARFEDHGPFRLAPEMPEFRPVRHAVRGPFVPSAELAPGPYVPSQAALEAGARHRADAANPNLSAPPPYRSAIPYASSQPAIATADIIAAGRGRFIWPVLGEVISPFGVKGLGRKNDGLDIKAAQGTVVHAAASGEVVYAGDQVPGFGNLVLIKHADGWVTAYAHLDHAIVRMRQSVVQGDEVGQVGLSGGVSEPQLHFEIRYAPRPTDKARPIDPQLILPK